MTGPENYREAERQIDCAIAEVTHGHPDVADRALKYAQAHATLALTAAVAASTKMSYADRHEWLKVTDPEYAAEQAAEDDCPACREMRRAKAGAP